MRYTMDPNAKMGSRISDLRLGDKPIEAGKTYKVAGWAPVAEEAKNAPGVKPVWEVVEAWLKSQGGRVKPRRVNTPKLVGMAGNTGLAG
jgi:sulfur-oxidizing protein SoxB